jgi:hypothetical protein
LLPITESIVVRPVPVPVWVIVPELLTAPVVKLIVSLPPLFWMLSELLPVIPPLSVLLCETPA